MFKRKTKTNHIIPNPFRIMFHILAAPSPDPITVPEPYQVVDWVNMRFKPALPNPVDCPVLSISKDPEVYHKQKDLYNLIDPVSSPAVNQLVPSLGTGKPREWSQSQQIPSRVTSSALL